MKTENVKWLKDFSQTIIKPIEIIIERGSLTMSRDPSNLHPLPRLVLDGVVRKVCRTLREKRYTLLQSLFKYLCAIFISSLIEGSSSHPVLGGRMTVPTSSLLYGILRNRTYFFKVGEFIIHLSPSPPTLLTI
ncbi:unnamed protein product [Leptosia nina]|uniref:Maturase K n=1 Tax=Leptosia nina TaxID=320188 RepID=A0AAV1JE80_9NEOP